MVTAIPATRTTATEVIAMCVDVNPEGAGPFDVVVLEAFGSRK